MASTVFLYVLFLSIVSSSVSTETPSGPPALILPVNKDQSTKQYVTQISQRTPLVPVKLTLDLGGEALWTDCAKGHISSTYKPVDCGASSCSLPIGTLGCEACHPEIQPAGCNNWTCQMIVENTLSHQSLVGELGKDVVAVQSYGSYPGPLVSAPRLLSACCRSCKSILSGLAEGIKGMAGLGTTPLGLPSQFSHAFGFPRKFAVCLSSSKGVVFFGDGPYVMPPGIDISQRLTYTPLHYFPNATTTEYYVGVEGIKINGKLLPINTTLLRFDEFGNGGTKISTVQPYTVLESSIYNVVTDAFVKSMANVPRVEPVKPFRACYKSSSMSTTRVGPGVPPIEFVLQNEKTSWTFFGANSMVQVNKDVLCLGFVDGGLGVLQSIVIGGHQLEDAILQFDLAKSRLGFASTILGSRTTCANFNFTSKA